MRGSACECVYFTNEINVVVDERIYVASFALFVKCVLEHLHFQKEGWEIIGQ